MASDGQDIGSYSPETIEPPVLQERAGGGKKRGHQTYELPTDFDDKTADDKRNRGNYRCGRCNLPKKGHICPFQPVLKPRERTVATQADAEVQVELDPDMTIACLGPLHLQGYPESYLEVQPKIRRVSATPP